MDEFGRELNDLLVSTYRDVMKIEELMLRDMSGGKLSISELHALESVGRGHNHGVTITEISQELGITLPSVTVMIQRLEKKGFVTKTRDSSDARRVLIRLTKEGLNADIAHRYFHRKMVNAVRRALPAESHEVMLLGMRSINEFFRRNLDSLEEQTVDEGGDKD